jgi:hypothetical protein
MRESSMLDTLKKETRMLRRSFSPQAFADAVLEVAGY